MNDALLLDFPFVWRFAIGDAHLVLGVLVADNCKIYCVHVDVVPPEEEEILPLTRVAELNGCEIVARREPRRDDEGRLEDVVVLELLDEARFLIECQATHLDENRILSKETENFSLLN